MKHPQDLDLLASNSTGNDVPGVQNHELTRAGHATRAAKTRLIGELPRRLQDAGYDQPSRHRIIVRNVRGFLVGVARYWIIDLCPTGEE